MFSIRRLTKQFSRQTLSEVKPAPLSETVDHTVEMCKNDDVFAAGKPFTGVSQVSSDPSSTSSSSDSEEEEEEAGPSRGLHRREGRGERLAPRAPRELRIERVPSAEKRKYSQYKYSTGSSSSASSSDDEIKEAFENSTCRQVPPCPPRPSCSPWELRGPLPPWGTEHATFCRPLKVLPTGYRKKSPKYFAQMSVPCGGERPFLDFNKMQHSKRLSAVRRPIVIRHNSRVHSIQRPPTLEVSLDLSKHAFQPVLTQT